MNEQAREKRYRGREGGGNGKMSDARKRIFFFFLREMTKRDRAKDGMLFEIRYGV